VMVSSAQLALLIQHEAENRKLAQTSAPGGSSVIHLSPPPTPLLMIIRPLILVLRYMPSELKVFL
jgi:hypothetical protein